jgi:hypothetical protein
LALKTHSLGIALPSNPNFAEAKIPDSHCPPFNFKCFEKARRQQNAQVNFSKLARDCASLRYALPSRSVLKKQSANKMLK